MNRRRRRCRERHSCVPRTRGDEPAITVCCVAAHVCVPRTRGDEPASMPPLRHRPMRVPRTRGDEPKSYDDVATFICVFPARAGMNRWYRMPSTGLDRVPRTRGRGVQQQSRLIDGEREHSAHVAPAWDLAPAHRLLQVVPPSLFCQGRGVRYRSGGVRRRLAGGAHHDESFGRASDICLYDRVGHGDRAGCSEAANLSKASCGGAWGAVRPSSLRTSFRLRPVAAIEMRFGRISP